jgi:hypothetical protein
MAGITATTYNWKVEFEVECNGNYYHAIYHRNELTMEARNLNTGATEKFEEIHRSEEAKNLFANFVNNN